MTFKPIATWRPTRDGTLFLFWLEGRYGGQPHVASSAGKPDNATHWARIVPPKGEAL
jgi:hypothetical protein